MKTILQTIVGLLLIIVCALSAEATLISLTARERGPANNSRLVPSRVPAASVSGYATTGHHRTNIKR